LPKAPPARLLPPEFQDPLLRSRLNARSQLRDPLLADTRELLEVRELLLYASSSVRISPRI